MDVIYLIYIRSIDDNGDLFIEPLTFRDTLINAKQFLREYTDGTKWSPIRHKEIYYKRETKLGYYDHLLCISEVKNLTLKKVKKY